MKKIKIQLCTLLIAMFSLSACASCSTEREEPMENGSEKNEQESTPDQKPQTPSDDNDVLVAYFSCTNTTKAVAEDIASITGGTLFRIEPEQTYSSADLNYNSDCRANREQNDPRSRPAIKHQIKDLDKIRNSVYWISNMVGRSATYHKYIP